MGPEEKVGTERLGSSDVIENYGSTLILVSVIAVAFVIIVVLLVYICKKVNLSEKNQARLAKLKRSLFFNPFIRYLQLNALKLNLSAMLTIKSFSSTSTTSKIVSIVTLVTINTIPVIFSRFVYKNRQTLQEENTSKKYGTIYAGKNVDADKDHKVWLYPLFFFFRRLIFIIATVFLIKYPSIQMMVH